MTHPQWKEPLAAPAGTTLDDIEPYAIVLGHELRVSGPGPFAVIGDRNVIRGERVFVRGDGNTIHGRTIGRVTGHNNFLPAGCTNKGVVGGSMTFIGGTHGISPMVSGDFHGDTASEAPVAYWPPPSAEEVTERDERSLYYERRGILYALRGDLFALRGELYGERGTLYGPMTSRPPDFPARLDSINRRIDIVDQAINNMNDYLDGLRQGMFATVWDFIHAQARDTLDQARQLTREPVSASGGVVRRPPISVRPTTVISPIPVTLVRPPARATAAAAPLQSPVYPAPWPEEPEAPDDTADELLCVICKAKRAATATQCGHVYSCVTCMQSKPKTCAICRQPLTAVIRLFQ